LYSQPRLQHFICRKHNDDIIGKMLAHKKDTYQLRDKIHM